ncbi:hypothetical protein [Streptomyces hirsutus]|uniref:hypothetical protein n=1 Tax=Streptomyces hirsutus TaxID=35620 RepID=UPI003F4DD03B
MIDAVRYVVDNGIKWRTLPAWRPNWEERLRAAVRRPQGRSPEPTAPSAHSQLVKVDAPSPTPHGASTPTRRSTAASDPCSPTPSDSSCRC